MRRNLSRFSYSAKIPRFNSSSAASLCTSSSGRGGSGRGRGSTFSKFVFTANDDSSPVDAARPPIIGHGRGRGLPATSSPILPQFSRDNAVFTGPSADRGHGRGTGAGAMHLPLGQSDPRRNLDVEDSDNSPTAARIPSFPSRAPNSSQDVPSSILSVLTGAGRGRTSNSPSDISVKPKEENRHIRARPTPEGDSAPRRRPVGQDSSNNRAWRGDSGGGGRGGGFRASENRGRGSRGRGGRGRGPGRELADSRSRFGDDDDDDDEDDEGDGLYLGDDADGEKLAQRLGPEMMDQLAEAFEESCSTVLPDPLNDAFVDALHTNLMLECEPEYVMEEFGTNPDIDEKPPISLRDALEKMKPFLMVYEGIESQQEWEEAIEELMKTVPLMEEIIDYYCGPDRITAKQQQKELERVAQTLPESTPASVKRFTDNAVLSLQSNPGWGFDKKCQLMDKLVREVSQNF